jgi:hypothetical protein
MFNLMMKEGSGKWQDFLGYPTTRKDAEMLIGIAKEMDLKNDIRLREYEIKVIDLTKELE